MSLKATVQAKIYPIRAALCVFTSSSFGSEDVMKKDYEEIRNVMMGLSEEEGKVLPEILPPHQIEALSRLFEEGPKEEHVKVFVSGKKRNMMRQKEREQEANDKMLNGIASNEAFVDMGMYGGKPSEKYFMPMVAEDMKETKDAKDSSKPKRKKRSAEETKALLAAMVNGGGDAPEDEASHEPETEAENEEPELEAPPKNDKADKAMDVFAGLLR